MLNKYTADEAEGKEGSNGILTGTAHLEELYFLAWQTIFFHHVLSKYVFP